MKAIISDTLPGNAHAAAGLVNDMGVAEHVLSINYDSGSYSTVMYRLERRDVQRFLEQTGKWDCTTERYKAMYRAWAAGKEAAKPKDFPEPPEQFKVRTFTPD